MATPEEFGWRLPVQSTSPPDVVRWLTDVVSDIAGTMTGKAAAADLGGKVAKSGDTMTGRLTISEGSLQLGTTAAADGRVYAGNQLVVYKAGTSSLTTVAHANATFGNQSATLSQALVLFGDGLPLAQARALGLSVVTDENGTPVGVPVGEVLGLLLARLAEGGVSL